MGVTIIEITTSMVGGRGLGDRMDTSVGQVWDFLETWHRRLLEVSMDKPS